MSHQKTQRYCLNPSEIATLARDGLGWGHDLDCGYFYAPALPQKAGVMTRVLRKFSKKD